MDLPEVGTGEWRHLLGIGNSQPEPIRVVLRLSPACLSPRRRAASENPEDDQIESHMPREEITNLQIKSQTCLGLGV